MFTLWYKINLFMHDRIPFPSFFMLEKKNEEIKGLPKDGELKQNSSLLQTSLLRLYDIDNSFFQNCESTLSFSEVTESYQFSFCDA